MNIKINFIRTSILLCFIVFSSAFFGCSSNPDVIYTNGKIHTMDKKNAIVEAIAVKDGKILDLGTSSEITGKYSAGEVIDLDGKIVLPGFIDTEGVLIQFSRNLNFINLSAAKNVAEIQALIKEKIDSDPTQEWIGGYGWNQFVIPPYEMDILNRSMLDEISTKHNIYLMDITGTAIWGNTKLFETSGISPQSEFEGDGMIEVDEGGSLTGLIFGDAMNLVRSKVPEEDEARLKSLVENGAKELLRWGITEVQDRLATSSAIEMYKELIDENRFPIRMYAVLTGGDESFESYIDKGIEVDYKDKLTIRAVSMDYDGAFEMQDAAMMQEYLQDPKVKTPYNSITEIENIFKRAVEKGFQLRVKAVGDGAVDGSLSAIERVIRDVNPSDHRTVLEHVEFIREKDLKRITDMKVIPSVRPDICMMDLELIPSRIDSSNVNNLGLWKSLLMAAGKITSGSEFPFRQINPFIQMYYLTTRQYVDTVISVPNQNQVLTLDEAIKSYTIWAAYSAFQEAYKGSLEIEKFADMVVISNDIFADNKNLLEAKVLKTIINGTIVYENKDVNQTAGE